MDPLFIEDKTRHTIFPIKYQDIWAQYQKQVASMWHVSEINLSQDLIDWPELTPNEQYFIKHVLAFFASSDLLVTKNLEDRFLDDVKVLEAKMLYQFQTAMENIHSEMYAKLIDVYITNPTEKDFTFNAVENIPIISEMAAWAEKWINAESSYAERLVAFSAYEGILFSGPFCAIYWLKERGKMPGLTSSNEFISRDEAMHVESAITIHNKLLDKCAEPRFTEIIKEAVDLEIRFCTVALPVALLGINANNMIAYIKHVANILALQYGYSSIYHGVKNPFPFMDRITIGTKKNFFEKKPTEYGKTNHNEDPTIDPYLGM